MNPFNFGFLGNIAADSGGVRPNFALAQTDHAEDNSVQTTYTWSTKAFAIGTADSTRLVIVGMAARSGTTGDSVTSVTIGGVAATQVAAARNVSSGALNESRLWQAAVPSGTTATITAVMSGTGWTRAGIVVFTIVGSNGSAPGAGAFATGTAAGAVTLSAITVPTGGAAIVCGVQNGTGTATSVTPTNYTTDLAQTLIGSTLYYSAGHDLTAGSRAYTMTFGGQTGPNDALVAGAWGP